MPPEFLHFGHECRYPLAAPGDEVQVRQNLRFMRRVVERPTSSRITHAAKSIRVRRWLYRFRCPYYTAVMVVSPRAGKDGRQHGFDFFEFDGGRQWLSLVVSLPALVPVSDRVLFVAGHIPSRGLRLNLALIVHALDLSRLESRGLSAKRAG